LESVISIKLSRIERVLKLQSLGKQQRDVHDRALHLHKRERATCVTHYYFVALFEWDIGELFYHLAYHQRVSGVF